jgi:hypothetical protein
VVLAAAVERGAGVEKLRVDDNGVDVDLVLSEVTRAGAADGEPNDSAWGWGVGHLEENCSWLVTAAIGWGTVRLTVFVVAIEGRAALADGCVHRRERRRVVH